MCKELKLENNLSRMTKYRVISDLIKSNILTTTKNSKKKKLKLANEVVMYFSEDGLDRNP